MLLLEIAVASWKGSFNCRPRDEAGPCCSLDATSLKSPYPLNSDYGQYLLEYFPRLKPQWCVAILQEFVEATKENSGLDLGNLNEQPGNRSKQALGEIKTPKGDVSGEILHDSQYLLALSHLGHSNAVAGSTVSLDI